MFIIVCWSLLWFKRLLNSRIFRLRVSVCDSFAFGWFVGSSLSLEPLSLKLIYRHLIIRLLLVLSRLVSLLLLLPPLLLLLIGGNNISYWSTFVNSRLWHGTRKNGVYMGQKEDEGIFLLRLSYKDEKNLYWATMIGYQVPGTLFSSSWGILKEFVLLDVRVFYSSIVLFLLQLHPPPDDRTAIVL